MLKYYANKWARPDHLHLTLFDPNSSNRYVLLRTGTRPLAIRAKEILAARGVELSQVEAEKLSETPPWLLPSFFVRREIW